MNLTIAVPYTDKSGKSYKPGDSADLPEGEARRVIESGYGRESEKPKTDKAAPAAAKTEGK